MRHLILASALVLSGCAGMSSVSMPELPGLGQPSPFVDSVKALAGTLPDGEIAVVRIANDSIRRLDTQALTDSLIDELRNEGREVVDLSSRLDASDLLKAREAGRAAGNPFLLYGKIREGAGSMRLRVMALRDGTILWSRNLPLDAERWQK
ncbi:hypothetical protein [Gallaecimonas sp. GXIMD4217]|uniref:hypothetical protein n=1 Tax=Gallaecimonas sp. GXIMD4217 TaxID=3131927 RepID=UPI00311B0905